MRTFLLRVLLFRKEDHSIRLNKEFHLDLIWWLEFFHSWNGSSFFFSPQWTPLPDFRCRGTWLAVSAVGLSLWLPGLQVLGPPHKTPMSMAYNGYFQWWWRLHFGVSSAPSDVLNCALTRVQLARSYSLQPRMATTLRPCFVACLSWWHSLFSHSQPPTLHEN